MSSAEEIKYLIEVNIKHHNSEVGHVTRTYNCWLNMKNRCYNTSHQKYDIYGGRGIKVCQKWKDSFESFLSDMGECPSGLSLNRKDSDGDYSPGNCEWSSQKEQQNNRRNNI